MYVIKSTKLKREYINDDINIYNTVIFTRVKFTYRKIEK